MYYTLLEEMAKLKAGASNKLAPTASFLQKSFATTLTAMLQDMWFVSIRPNSTEAPISGHDLMQAEEDVIWFGAALLFGDAATAEQSFGLNDVQYLKHGRNVLRDTVKIML